MCYDRSMIGLSRETEALARRIASARHLPVDAIIRAALEQKVRQEGIVLDEPHRPRDRSSEGIAARRSRTDRLVVALAAMPMLDERSPREIADDLDSL